MTNTKDKLIEAKYFLERMFGVQSERDAFRYNLSAFLCAARSVTLFMQKEFSRVKDFDKWYARKQGQMLADKGVKFLNEKRVMTIHKKPVKPSAHIKGTAKVSIGISVSASAVVTRANGTVEKIGSEPKPEPKSAPAKTEATVEWQWYFSEIRDKDVVTICKEHIRKLEDFVEECESLFALNR